MDTIEFVPIEKIIVNQYQPAEFVDQAQVLEIAESLKRYRENGQKGLLQVPLARRVNGVYEEAFGRHRLLAFQYLAKEDPFWSEMPLMIKDLSDREMFELMGVENFKRRDISVIEKARIFHDHMQRFGATSVQTAETFGVTEETVRGTVRMLNLPPVAQESLQKGSINVTAARALLSVQKIAPEKAVLEMVQQLEKGEDRWGNKTMPEKIIEAAVRHLDETEEMWDDDRGGKPRSSMSYRDEGWLLSMKNFPNKLLSELTPVDVAIALGIQDDADMMAHTNIYLQSKLGTLDQEDMNMMDLRVSDLQLPADLAAKIDHLLNPSACTACPFYARIDGTHICGMKTCHTRKMVAWHLNQLQSASRDLGIALYAEQDGKYKLLDAYDKGDIALFKKRHADLRLLEREKVRAYHYQHFDGVNDNVCFVVVVGKTRENLEKARKEARTEVKQLASAAEHHQDLFEENCKLLEWEATLSIKTLFDGLNLIALNALEEAGFDWSTDGDDAPEDDWKLDDDPEAEQENFKRRIIALSMLHEAPHRFENRQENIETFGTWIKETAKTWGVTLPRSFTKMVTKMTAELAVTAETEKEPA